MVVRAGVAVVLRRRLVRLNEFVDEFCRSFRGRKFPFQSYVVLIIIVCVSPSFGVNKTRSLAVSRGFNVVGDLMPLNRHEKRNEPLPPALSSLSTRLDPAKSYRSSVNGASLLNHKPARFMSQGDHFKSNAR